VPIVLRSEVDMLRFSSFTDILIDPVNCVGHIGGGLARAFAEKWPEMATEYKSLGEQGKFSLGNLHIFHDEKSKNILINVMTKKDWRDITTLEDVELCYQKLEAYLRKYPFYTVVMPALGTGSGRLDPIFGESLLMKYLDPLPNIIHLSMRPDRFEKTPLYLGVVGSRHFNNRAKIKVDVELGLKSFGLSYSDFNGMVSGGAVGVDSIACGTGKPTDLDMNLALEHGVRAIVCQADWERYGNAAGFLRNRTISDIATHIVAFVGSKSVGTKGLIDLVNRYNATIDRRLSEQVAPKEWDMFDRPPLVIPEKKQLHIVDISSISM